MAVNLSKAQVVNDGEVLMEKEVHNICQTAKWMTEVKDQMPTTAHLLVYCEDGATLFKDYIIKETAAGRQLVNLITSTNRGQVAKARREAAKLEAEQVPAIETDDI